MINRYKVEFIFVEKECIVNYIAKAEDEDEVLDNLEEYLEEIIFNGADNLTLKDDYVYRIEAIS